MRFIRINGRGGAKIYIDGKMVSDNRDDYCPRGGGLILGVFFLQPCTVSATDNGYLITENIKEML